MGGVPQKDEPRQPDAPSRVYRQAPWTDSVGGPDSQPPLHRGRVAQAQDCLVRCYQHSNDHFLLFTRDKKTAALTSSLFTLK